MLKALKEKYNNCNRCSSCVCDCKVFGGGNTNADIMIIGESPGDTEIERGEPFTGLAGQMFNKILTAIDLKREDLYFSNAILCKTNEKYRSPSWEEIQNCADRLDEEINTVKPNVILMVGSHSLKRFFGKDSKVTESHGRWFLDFKPPYARYFSTYHTSWALHSSTPGEQQAKKRVIWEDIKTFSRDLEITNFNLRSENA